MPFFGFDPGSFERETLAMKTVFAIIALLVGAWLIYSGWQRRESLAGQASEAISELGRKVDGKTRIPEHTWYLAGGALLVLGGVTVLFVGRRK
jgi:uncharacterized membrane protein YphA (DoxX/SURF4 family)